MSRPVRLTNKLIDSIVGRLAENKQVRRAMPLWGRLHVDRQLPFMVVYRQPSDAQDAGTFRLAVGAASYLLVSGRASRLQETARLIEGIAQVMVKAFGAFLIIEVWAGADGPDEPVGAPAYRVCHHKDERIESTAKEFASALETQRVLRQRPLVSISERTRVAPPGMKPLFTKRALDAMGAHLVGVEVAPVYRDGDGEVYPIALRQFSRRMSIAVDRAAYRFTHARTTARPASFHTLGRQAFVRAVREVDTKLADIGASFDPLLLVTPVNAEQAWLEFRRSNYSRQPAFVYRPLPEDPRALKARLWAIRPDRVEDPTLLYLFRDTQAYFDRQINLLLDIDRDRFLHTSIQLYGGVEPGLLALANQLLDTLPTRASEPQRSTLSAQEFAGLATSEILCYRERTPDFGTIPEVRADMYSGLMVSSGQFYIGSEARIPTARADALIQHEIGTHVVTYYNGGVQPFHLLRVGLPGYDELQEGLAVLGEYIAGGLDAPRMRTLAARVVAVAAMIDGASFAETWQMLRDRRFPQRAAFTITTRVYRGGGLTKDAMYLRGLSGILDYMAEGNSLDSLFLGKFGVRQVPVVEELLARETLSQPRVLPRYLERPEAGERIAALSRGLTVTDLVKGRGKRS